MKQSSRNPIIKAILFILTLLLFTVCEHNEFAIDILVSNHRTVLVYLGTDNNFRYEAAEKIKILTENWSEDFDGNLLVYSDTGEKPVLVHIYYTEKHGNIADTIAAYYPENSANPATLTLVLNRVKKYCPAQSYGLVVLSHATGWLPAEMSEPAPQLKSVILDKFTDETYGYMELADFAAAIPYKLDFIIFDACFMGSVEVACELKDKVDYIVASPAEVLVPGFAYTDMMRNLFASQPELRAVAREFYEYYENKSGLYQSATVSVTKTAELGNIINLFREITEKTHDNTNFNLSAIQTFGYGSQKIYFDLGDYIQKLAPEKYNEFQSALDSCILYKACTDSYYSAGTGKLQAIRMFSGLSVYIPQVQYPKANEAYKKLKWTKEINNTSFAIDVDTWLF